MRRFQAFASWRRVLSGNSSTAKTLPREDPDFDLRLGDQQLDWVRPKDDQEVFVGADMQAGISAEAEASGQTGAIQGVSGRATQAGVWIARVLLRELRSRNYTGGYTLLTDWLRPQREAAHVIAVRRFETPPGKHYGESGVMVRTGRRSAFGAGAATHVPLLGAT